MNLWMQQHAATLVDRAALALDASLFDEAAADLDGALRMDPGHAEALQMRLSVDLMRNRCEEALAIADQLAAYHPSIAASPAVRLSVAEAHGRLGRHQDAVRTLERLVEQSPDAVDAWRALAGLRMRLGRDEPAAAALRRVLELEPDNAQARRQLARLVGHTDPQAAIDLLTWQGHGDDPLVRLDAARLCLHVDRLRDAQDLLDRVMLAHGDDPAACIEAGNLADRFGDRPGARALLEFASATRGSHQPDAVAALAVSHLHAGAFADAAWAYRRLARLADREDDFERATDAMAGLTVAGLGADRPRLAGLARRRLLAMLSGDEEACRTAIAGVWRHAAAARIIAATRRKTVGGGQADGSAEAGREDPAGDTLRPMLARAVSALRASADREPDRADTLYHLAVCEHELGEQASARATLDKALALNPDYADARRLAMRLSAMRPADAEPVKVEVPGTLVDELADAA